MEQTIATTRPSDPDPATEPELDAPDADRETEQQAV
jgi:hypothetical protein